MCVDSLRFGRSIFQNNVNARASRAKNTNHAKPVRQVVIGLNLSFHAFQTKDLELVIHLLCKTFMFCYQCENYNPLKTVRF